MNNKRGGVTLWLERIGLVVCFLLWSTCWGWGALTYQLWSAFTCAAH